ncbi:MAG: hypothetical protein Q4A52_02260 [Bacillota bacterium]|nr:hypothetical protein [Bacillota bacterium]
MGIDQIVVAAVLIAALFSVFVLCVEFVLPLFTKLAFDQICRDYLLVAEMNNGLATDDVDTFQERLASLGLRDVRIDVSGPGEVKRGDWIRIKVSAMLDRSRLTGLFQRGEESLTLSYQRRFLARKIVE